MSCSLVIGKDDMASEAQMAANRANAQKSTGPRTEEGKARSSMNGLKHGMRAKRENLVHEDSVQFQNDFFRISRGMVPLNDPEKFWVQEQAGLMYLMGNITRVSRTRQINAAENADVYEETQASELGSRLFFDRCGSIELRGIQQFDRKAHTSWSGEA